jgi:hypothetical protein
VRLFEIGASAGLNLRADHYLYKFSGGQWGADDAPVIIDEAWRGRRPPAVDLRIVERHGYDIAPIDVTRNDAKLTLLSYVWPDQPTRLRRLQAAVDIARQVPADLERMTAAAAVERLRLIRGTLTVLWHSVTWQYLPQHEQEKVREDITALGAAATAETPLAWLSFEPQHHIPESANDLWVQVRCWPDGNAQTLGVSAPHPPPITWK